MAVAKLRHAVTHLREQADGVYLTSTLTSVSQVDYSEVVVVAACCQAAVAEAE